MVVCLVSSPLVSALPRTLELIDVRPTFDRVTIQAELPRTMVSCPQCSVPSHRLHSRYKRTLSDLPWQGRPATIQIAARRFRCLNTACGRKTFAEHLGTVAGSLARRTTRLGDLQRYVAFALGGEVAAKLTDRLAIPASADTLLRMVVKPIQASAPPPETKILGVDDWAWKRGRRYGTIIVDLERNEVIDLLPDRQAETLAAWLRLHPGIEVVARDRAGAYADGIRQGAPKAIQVSDRWHLLRNLGDATRAVVDRYHGAIQRAAKQMSKDASPIMADETQPTPDLQKMTPTQRRSQDAHARRHSRYEEAAQLRSTGVSIAGIAASLGVERKTIRRWLRAGRAPVWEMPSRTSILAPYRAYLDARWAAGCRNVLQLWRDLVTQGFSGRPGILYKWSEAQRRAEPRGASKSPVAPVQILSNRQLTRQLMTEPTALSEPDRTLITHLLDKVPPIAAAMTAAKQLNAVFRRKSSESLIEILDAASTTPLKDFVAGLRRDLSAIQAALDLPWTTSPVEGQINRLKMLKRTMYGRAGFPLLRARVLHAA